MKSAIMQNLQRQNQKRQQNQSDNHLSVAGFSLGDQHGYPQSMISPLYSPSDKFMPNAARVQFSGTILQASNQRLNSPEILRKPNNEQLYQPSPIQIALEQQKKIHDLESHVDDLTIELDTTKNDLAMKEDTIEMLKKELSKCQQYVLSHEKLLEATVKLEHYKRENESLTNDNNAVQLELDTIKNSYAELLEINKSLTNKLQQNEKIKASGRSSAGKDDNDEVVTRLTKVRLFRHTAFTMQDR
jgi:hypothetical protein